MLQQGKRRLVFPRFGAPVKGLPNLLKSQDLIDDSQTGICMRHTKTLTKLSFVRDRIRLGPNSLLYETN